MKKLILLIATSIAQYCGLAEWVPTDGPYGGSFNSVVSFGGEVFASTWGNIFVSSNHGVTWGAVGGVSLDGNNGLFVVDSSVILWHEGVYYRTTDGGESWSHVFEDLEHVYKVYSFLKRGADIYAGTRSNGVYRSTNHGLDWTSVNDGMGQQSVTGLVEARGYLFAATDSYGLFRFSDTTQRWTLMNGSPSGLTLAANDSILLIGTYGGLYRSTDLGSTWMRMDLGIIDSLIWSIGFHGMDVYVGTLGGSLCRSTNNGSTWSNVSAGLAGGEISSFSSDGTALFTGTGNGIFVTTDDGFNWHPSDHGVNATGVGALIGVGDRLFAGTTHGLFSAIDATRGWIPIADPSLRNSWVHVLAKTNNMLFAGTTSRSAFGYGGGIYRTEDNGQTWNHSLLLNRQVRDLVVPAADGSKIYAGTDWYVWYSANGGWSWIHRYGGLQAPYDNAIAIKDPFIFAGSLGDGVNRSMDNGFSWIGCNNGLQGGEVSDLAVDGDNILAGTERGGWISTDNGGHWQSLIPEILNTPVSQFYLDDQRILAATNAGVYFSSDHGSTWRNWSEGLPLPQVASVTVFNGYAYAGTNRVWRRPLSDLVGVQEKNINLPAVFLLKQNYPNPFNPTTTISFDLPKSTVVRLSVHDVLGRQVITLRDGFMSAGEYNVELNASDLASGIYFYRIEAGQFAATKKLLLLR